MCAHEIGEPRNVVCEFTNATTTEMVNPVTRLWATALMENLGLPSDLPAPIVEPGSLVGTLKAAVSQGTSLCGTPVIAPACHDTGSAVAAISARDGTAFLSSGTWSLLGVELDAPMVNSEALRLNFTNEGGIAGTTRFHKNVMGLWMLQCCRHSWGAEGNHYEYRELMELAASAPAFTHLIDPDDSLQPFLHITSAVSINNGGQIVITEESLCKASDDVIDLMKQVWRDDEGLKKLSCPIKDSSDKLGLIRRIKLLILKVIG